MSVPIVSTCDLKHVVFHPAPEGQGLWTRMQTQGTVIQRYCMALTFHIRNWLEPLQKQILKVTNEPAP